MNKPRKDKRTSVYSQHILSFSQENTLTATIQAPFLKDRVAAYVDSAATLVHDLSHDQSTVVGEGRESISLKESINSYGKRARLLDMILAIAGASGYLNAQDKITAHKIRQSAERKLDTYVKREGDGIVRIASPVGSLKVKTHSSIGRRIAGLFARVVPPTAQDKAPNSAPRMQLLPEAADDKIKAFLASAQADYAAGRFIEAEAGFKKVLDIDRKQGEAIRQLGRIYLDSSSISTAIKYLEEASFLCPRDPELLNELGMAFIEDSNYDEAIKKFQEALYLAVDNTDSLLGLGMAYLMKGSDTEALDTFKRALRLSPNSADVLARLGYYHQIHNELEDAAIHYTRALKLVPNYPIVLNRLGALRCQQRKNEQGFELLDKALRLQPENVDFLCSKAYALLTAGDYKNGWALYEHGLKTPKWRKTDLFPKKTIWKGELIPNKKLLLLSEQGLGDALQFVRYAALCKKRAGAVYVLCREPLARLFKNCPYIDQVFTGIGRWKFDEQISMMSLPHVFKTTLDNIPAETPYLYVPANMQKEAGRRLQLSEHETKLKVGLVWSGSLFANSLRGDLRAKRRNLDLRQLLPLFESKDVVFYNLQMGDEARQIDKLGLRDQFVDGMADVKDMLDTAAIIENLDLVISVDTSVAHLAGALGKPVWIMSRYDADWRWLMNRADSPWYPTARVFGQPSTGDWNSVVKNICNALEERIALLPKSTI